MPAIGLIGFVWFVFFFNPQKMRVRIGKVDKIEKVSGNKDGFHTDIHYMLYTDKGTFRINISGFVAHPELVGRIKNRLYMHYGGMRYRSAFYWGIQKCS